MQLSYFIINDINEVIAIFTDEVLAREYLEYMMMDDSNCKIGMLPDSTFWFEEHDAKYYTLENSSLDTKRCMDCSRFKEYNNDNGESLGYCFLNDEMVDAFQKACNLLQEKKI